MILAVELLCHPRRTVVCVKAEHKCGAYVIRQGDNLLPFTPDDTFNVSSALLIPSSGQRSPQFIPFLNLLSIFYDPIEYRNPELRYQSGIETRSRHRVLHSIFTRQLFWRTFRKEMKRKEEMEEVFWLIPLRKSLAIVQHFFKFASGDIVQRQTQSTGLAIWNCLQKTELQANIEVNNKSHSNTLTCGNHSL